MRTTRPLSIRDIPMQVIDWVDSRIGVKELVATSLHVVIPRGAHTYYLGGITLFVFISQAVTGILLSMYYEPTPDAAYSSILYIMNQVNFGWLIRSVHAWGANLMIIFCILHMIRVIVQGAYKPPREVTWMAGMALLFITLGFGFTGYLLPWDQRAYWATTVGTTIPEAMPLIGEWLRDFLRAGSDISALTLSRFLGVHMLILPASLLGVFALHFIAIHLHGIADPHEEEKR